MKSDWLRRYCLTERDLPQVEIILRDDLGQKFRFDLAIFFSILRDLPADCRSHFQFLFSDEIYISVFGAGIDATDRLAIWVMDHEAFFDRHGSDPFHCMRSYPISAKDGLEIAVPSEMIPPPRREIAKVREIFRTGDGAFLLGATQALVDSSGVLLRRSKPDAKIIEQLWAFLPYSARDISFFSYWNGNVRDTDASKLLVVPQDYAATKIRHLSEDQCRDYPESYFERQLQYALDFEDQALFDQLMARRSSKATLKLALTLVVFAFVVLAASKLILIAK